MPGTFANGTSAVLSRARCPAGIVSRRGRNSRLLSAAVPRHRPGSHGPLTGADATDRGRDGYRPAARDDPVERFLPREGVARLGPPAHSGPAAREHDRHRVWITVFPRVQPAGRGQNLLQEVLGPRGGSGARLTRCGWTWRGWPRWRACSHRTGAATPRTRRAGSAARAASACRADGRRPGAGRRGCFLRLDTGNRVLLRAHAAASAAHVTQDLAAPGRVVPKHCR